MDNFDSTNEHVVEQLSFLPKPDFNPRWPNPNTLPASAIARMLNSERITHRDFDNETGSWRLAAVIYTLKGLGWPIASSEIPSPTVENPHRVISRYYLPANVIREVFSNGIEGRGNGG